MPEAEAQGLHLKPFGLLAGWEAFAEGTPTAVLAGAAPSTAGEGRLGKASPAQEFWHDYLRPDDDHDHDEDPRDRNVTFAALDSHSSQNSNWSFLQLLVF